MIKGLLKSLFRDADIDLIENEIVYRVSCLVYKNDDVLGIYTTDIPLKSEINARNMYTVMQYIKNEALEKYKDLTEIEILSWSQYKV